MARLRKLFRKFFRRLMGLPEAPQPKKLSLVELAQHHPNSLVVWDWGYTDYLATLRRMYGD